MSLKALLIISLNIEVWDYPFSFNSNIKNQPKVCQNYEFRPL